MNPQREQEFYDFCLKMTERRAILECRVAFLERALEKAAKECEEHNSEYSHRTPDSLLQAWYRLLGSKKA